MSGMTKIAPRTPVLTKARPRLMRTALGAVIVGVLLTACSAPADGDRSGDPADQVASVAESTGPKATRETPRDAGAEAVAAAAAGQAPQRRLDSTEPETLAMFQPYLQCLKDRDVPIQRAGRGGAKPGSGKGEEVDPSMLWYASVDMADYPAAEKACNPIRPLMPRELDPKRNPDYLKDFRAQIECMEARGVKVTGLPDGSGWNFRDGYEPTDETPQIEQECQMKAFGDQG